MPRLLYIHVPKCGGSSFGAALRLRYAYSQATIDLRRSRAMQKARAPFALGEDRIVAEYDQRDRLLAELLKRGKHCIAAHVRYDPALHDTLAQDRAWITLLREPVDRFVSHYRYLQRKHPDPKRPDTLEAFLETPDAARIASQYLFYFARVSQTLCSDVPAAVRAAQEALGRFALIGDLSRPAAFARGLRRITGTPLPVLARNRAPALAPALSPGVTARIEQLCAADIAIYRHAQGLEVSV